MTDYYFENVDDLVQHLLYKFNELSPLKLQKGLYFLFAFYSGNYQNSEEDGVSESNYEYPKYLFDANFEAWTYGPVIREVYSKNKAEQYIPTEYDFGVSPVDKEIKNFIDDVFEMILEKSDFALVDRSHEDKVWKDAISKGKSSIMLKEDIANEYQEIFQCVG